MNRTKLIVDFKRRPLWSPWPLRIFGSIAASLALAAGLLLAWGNGTPPAEVESPPPHPMPTGPSAISTATRGEAQTRTPLLQPPPNDVEAANDSDAPAAKPDPFQAFLESSNNGSPPAAVAGQGTAQGKPLAPRQDPFKAALEDSKRRPASLAYPFAPSN